MGQRANYIIKNHDKLTIHYNHWRANCIASDLYLGEKRFLQFVQECQLKDEIINEPWIEGCVIIDIPLKQIHFWTLEFTNNTSVIEYYLPALEERWQGWTAHFLNNRMYDVEKILNIDYISTQELPTIGTWSKEKIVGDQVEEWVTALIIIKNGDDLFVTKTGNINTEVILRYGQDIIPLLLDKPKSVLPNEDDQATYECIIIDIIDKKLYINQSIFGLWEQCLRLWEAYELTMGDFGYIETLRLVGLATTNLKMTDAKVIEEFKHIIKYDNNFDPHKMAENLTRENSDAQFNPDFFDTVRPQKSIWDRLKHGVKRALGR